VELLSVGYENQEDLINRLCFSS